jgi:antirestriction protein ArdC
MAPTVYEVITARIVEKLEQGTVPWRRPWSVETGAPRNIRGTLYRGINVFLLGCQAYESPYWLTFNQARELGGSVRRGERGSPVVFWKWLEKIDSATGQKERIPLLRYYTVFNAAQCEAVPIPRLEQPAATHRPIEECERVVQGYEGGPAVHHGGGIACYSPMADRVSMPKPESFASPEAYYSTLLHELSHSTGHRSRLAREGVIDPKRFGSHAYSREELVAEMSAAFLAGRCGIETRTLDNSASYLASWLRVLRGDSRLVVIAAGQAQKAADWILGIRRVEEAEPELAKAA